MVCYSKNDGPTFSFLLSLHQSFVHDDGAVRSASLFGFSPESTASESERNQVKKGNSISLSVYFIVFFYFLISNVGK